MSKTSSVSLSPIALSMRGTSDSSLHVANAEDATGRRTDEGRVAQRCQVDEQDAPVEVIEKLAGHLERQPGLSGPACARERDEASVGHAQQSRDGGQLELTPDERPCGRGHVRRRWGGGAEPELAVMPKDGRVQLLELGRWLEAELLDENGARGPECLERVGLASRAIERQHQLGSESLAVGVLGSQRLELRHEVVMEMHREIRVDATLDGEQTELLDPCALDRDERGVRHVGQRDPTM